MGDLVSRPCAPCRRSGSSPRSRRSCLAAPRAWSEARGARSSPPVYMCISLPTCLPAAVYSDLCNSIPKTGVVWVRVGLGMGKDIAAGNARPGSAGEAERHTAWRPGRSPVSSYRRPNSSAARAVLARSVCDGNRVRPAWGVTKTKEATKKQGARPAASTVASRRSPPGVVCGAPLRACEGGGKS